jgi:hypothetical protein
VTHDVGEQLPLRILAEEPRLDVDSRKAVAVRREAGDFLIGKSGAYRQALEALALLQQLEAAPIAGANLDDLRQIVDSGVEVATLPGVISSV